MATPMATLSTPMLQSFRMASFLSQTSSFSALRAQTLFSSAVAVRPFSTKTRKCALKRRSLRNVTKYKLKTKKSAQKRYNVVGGLRDRTFKHFAVGHRHLNRNKSHRNRKAAKRPQYLTHLADAKKMRRMMPYFKRRKALRG
jgi:ribosomal protein L35